MATKFVFSAKPLEGCPLWQPVSNPVATERAPPKQMGLIGLMGPIEVNFITPITPMSPILPGVFACFFEFDLCIVVDKMPIYVEREKSGDRSQETE